MKKRLAPKTSDYKGFSYGTAITVKCNIAVIMILLEITIS